jgi:hypothetical protein
MGDATAVRAILLILSAVLVPTLAPAKKKSIRYPRVSAVEAAQLVEDQVEVVQRQGKHHETNKKLRVGQNLRDKAVIQVGENGHLRLELAPQARLLIEGNSVVEMPVIAWEDGAIDKIILHRGRLQYICSENCQRNILTDLSAETPGPGNYVFTYEPTAPRVEVMVIAGELSFRGLENETSVTLKAGQKASFMGKIEDNEIAYDVLLKGRKIAKGHLSPIEALTPAEQKKYTESAVVKKVAPKKKATARQPGQICEKPFAKLNECQWACEGNPKKAKNCAVDRGAHCVRYRCNANGEWAEAHELPADLASQCGLKPLVKPCDY